MRSSLSPSPDRDRSRSEKLSGDETSGVAESRPLQNRFKGLFQQAAKEQSGLRNNQNGSSPESCLLCCRIEDRNLAVVISGNEAIDTKAEVERHGSKPTCRTGNDRGRGGFKDLVFSEVKADEGEKRLARRRAARLTLLIGLEVDVQVVTRTENSSHTGNKLFSVLHQRIDCGFLLLVRAFLNVIQRFFQIDALAA